MIRLLHGISADKIKYEPKRKSKSFTSHSTSPLGSMNVLGVSCLGNPFLGFQKPADYNMFCAQQQAQCRQEDLIRQMTGSYYFNYGGMTGFNRG